jgi:hypothetical protein
MELVEKLNSPREYRYDNARRISNGLVAMA